MEYGEWKTGIRTEGTTYALFSFTRKAGQGIGGAAAAFTIGLGGYVAQSQAQPDSAVNAIKIAAGACPPVHSPRARDHVRLPPDRGEIP